MHPYRDDDCRAQIEKLEMVRNERDGAKVSAALDRILEDAGAGNNVMPSIVDAVKAYATVGEITDRLVKVFGRFQEPIRFD